ncbi:tubulin-specific chaperone C-like [Tubulanus polymorphus]|uniref:tubulin-specific chaperone C-like n=1 Tax=Tubulanus polymorphus TaxID=672921 RepID=UPI003DA2E777
MTDNFDPERGMSDKTSDFNSQKVQVTERLKKRDDDRLADAQKRREEKESSAAQNETIGFFTKGFKQEKLKVESLLEECESLSKPALTNHFDKLTVSVQNLQKFLTDSTVFLPSYEVQAAQKAINKLQAAITEKREALIPKKKFVFKGKLKKSAPVKVAETKTEDSVDGFRDTTNYALFECSFIDMCGQQLSKSEEEINNKDVALSNLSDCTIKLTGAPSAMHVNKLKDCVVLCGPISGSIFIDNCSNCSFVVACQQLRIHSTTDSKFYIHVTSRAIIEDCSNVEFAPYCFAYDQIDRHYLIAGLDRKRNNWNDIDDFNWLASDTHSPNWSLIEESEHKHWN